MTRTLSSSARNVALGAAFCALGIAPGCGRETFELLPDSAFLAAGNGSIAGSPQAGSAGLGGSPAASGSAGVSGGGKAGSGGTGGRFGTGPSCLGEGGCPDDEDPSGCTRSSPFPLCIPCRSPKDCAVAGEAKICDPEHKRCVECIDDFQCRLGEACNQLNQRCAKTCDGNNDSCGTEGLHLSCSRELGVCVSCIRDADCAGYGPNTHCYQNFCVECFEDHHCPSQSCLGGHCKM
jgi:hypothetical protein